MEEFRLLQGRLHGEPVEILELCIRIVRLRYHAQPLGCLDHEGPTYFPVAEGTAMTAGTCVVVAPRK